MPPICYLTAQSHALKEVTSDLFKKHPLADFSKLIFVSSNSRSNRLLEQLILQEVDRKQLWQDFKAPKFARLGSLPEIILDYDDSNIASPAACHLAWINALSTVNPSEAKINLGVNIKSPSETLILSELLAQFILRLESEQMCCKVMGLEHADNETESKRMLFLHSLYIKYLEFLEQAGLSDKHQLRRLALDQAKVKLEDDLRIVLVCIPELSKFQKSLLSNCDEQLDIYQFKFPHLQSPYDEFGCVIPDKFISNECVPLNNTNVVFAENPREMVKKAINAIQHSSNKIAPEDISFSVLEKDCEPLLSEELSKFELNLRSAVGIELSRSLVVQLLQDLHNYLADPSFNNAEALLNHPDLCFAPELTKNLNLHQQQHLPTQLPGAFINKLPKIVSQNTTGLHQGITAVQSFLSEVYGDLKINPEQSDDSHLQARALQTVDALIDELLQIAPLLSEDPKLRFNLRRCIAFLLHQCKNKFLPPRHIENSVENLDWLELNLDPATYKVIIGFNENYVPGKFSNIPFVSNEMALKCEFYSERQRLARDSFTLQSLVAVNSKDDSNLHLIVGHSNNEGSILLPPRLLFLGDTEKSYSNIEKYSAEQVPPLSSPAPPPQTRALPTSNHGTPERVSVTAVNTFLRSPYSFYLNYILKLKSPQSDCNELSPLLYGNLCHDVLQLFGESELKNSTSSTEIFNYLCEQCELICQQQYPDCNSLVKTQVELLKIRFKKFAKVQAKRAEDGWKILHCEYELPKGCRLFGSNFDISGKIDRIDVRDNEICLIDYKTPNDSKNYKKIFRKNKFSDLQLPLYQFLSKFIEGGKYDGMRKSIAYFLLTANPNETDVYSIDFEEDERSAAEIQCTDIFEAINQQRWLELGKAPFASEAEKAIRGDSLLCSRSALEGNQ